jgi:hypothetical protein
VPLSIYPQPEFFIRRYVKFTPSTTGNKNNTKFGKVSLPKEHRHGTLRVVEFGVIIDNTIK